MKLTIPKNELATKLSMVSKVVPAKAVKAILQGILFKVSDGVLTISATDLETGFVTEIREFTTDGEGAFVVEGKVADEVVRSLPGSEIVIEYDGISATANPSNFVGSFLLSLNSMKDFASSVRMASSDELLLRFDGRRVGFSFDGTQMIVRVVDAEFPNYKTVLPQEFRTRIVVEKNTFIEALKRVSIAARLGSETVKLEVGDEVMKVSARSSDRGEAVEEIEVKKDGEDMIIGFNPRFLLEACQHVDTENVELNFKDSNGPVQINPVDVEGYLYIVMPVRLV